MIFPPIEQELHNYLKSLCEELECTVVNIGGYSDHVHILCELSKKVAFAKLLEIIKCNSSKWIKTKGPEYSGFYWQDGYGCFSLSKKDLKPHIRYIKNQKEHHGKKGFEGEFKAFLKKHDLKYDPELLFK